MLIQRVITAVLLLLALIVATTQLSSFYFSIFISLPILMAAWEWSGLIGLTSSKAKLGYMLSIAVMLVGVFFMLEITPESSSINIAGSSMILILGLLFWVVSLFLLMGYPGNSSVWNGESKIALMGVLVLIPTFTGIVSLKFLMPNGYLVLALVILVAAVDIGAYFVGVNFGSRKLAEKLSPKKSREGVWGGMLFCMLVGVGFICLLHKHLQTLSLSQIILLLILTVGVTFFSVVGDLIESMLKRNRGVKDSGALLPGHGGLLDRVDGLVAATPLFALTMIFILNNKL